MRFTAETCPNVRVLEMQNFIPAYMRGWTYVGTYASRSIFSEPKFLGCIDYQIFLPMVLLYALFAHARARPLLHLKKLQNRFGCDSQNHEAGIRRHYHGREDFYYLRHLRSTVRLLPPGPGFLKISLLHSQKYSIQWLVCISFKDGNRYRNQYPRVFPLSDKRNIQKCDSPSKYSNKGEYTWSNPVPVLPCCLEQGQKSIRTPQGRGCW